MLLTEERAQSILQSLPGEIGLYVCDTVTGESISFHADQPIEAASVIKLSVMAEAFRQREAGVLDFNRVISIRSEDCLPSCGAITYMHRGITLPVSDLVTLMIIVSDNTATNLLIDLLGMDAVNGMIDQIGLKSTRLNRKLFQPELAARGIKNYVSAEDCGRIMQMLLQGKLVSTEASAEMLRLLRSQRLTGKMPFHLHSRGIACAHKTGEDSGITHDVGIIFADTPRIFCFVSQYTNVPAAERALQDLAALAADIEM